MANVIVFKNALMREFIRLCRGNDFNKLSLLTIGETVDKVLEAHYRNFPIEDAPAVNPLPCKIGDTVWAVLHYYGKQCIRQCVVSEMAYLEDMTLAIAVKAAGKTSQRVFWGVNCFATREECEAAIGGKDNG